MKRSAAALMILLFAIPLLSDGQRSGPDHDLLSKATQQQYDVKNLQLKISIGNKTLMATFIDSKTTQEFISMLPLTLNMDDLGGREKYSALSKELSKTGNVQTSFQKGDISYWLGGGIATYYNNDGHQIKAGLITLARLNSGIEEFQVPSSIKVKFEAVKKQ